MVSFEEIRRWFLDILFPPICSSCKKSLEKKNDYENLCRACLEKSITNETLFCAICHARLPDNKKICHKQAKYILGAPTEYRNPVARELIWQLKYNQIEACANGIAEILSNYIKRSNIELSESIIIPVPLYKTKQQKRGFNQAELISEILSRKTGALIVKNVAKKTKETRPQTEMKDWEERKKNITDSFKVKNVGSIKNKNLVIVDDVTTSGATMSELALVLKNAGAKRIIGLALTKAR